MSAIIAATAIAALPAQAQDVSYNATLTSNYIWRGTTQTDDKPALQVGADIDLGKNLYAGVWASNVDFGDDANYELDIYGGYAADYQGISYDIGYLAYVYDSTQDLDFAEIYLNLGAGGFTVSAFVIVNSEGSDPTSHDVYYALSYATPLTIGGEDIDVSLSVGLTAPEQAGAQNTTNYAIALTNDGFTLVVSDTDADADDSNLDITLSYAIDF